MNKFANTYPQLVFNLEATHRRGMMETWETIAPDVFKITSNPSIDEIIEFVLDAGRLEVFASYADWKGFRKLSYSKQTELAKKVLAGYA